MLKKDGGVEMFIHDNSRNIHGMERNVIDVKIF